MMRSQWFTSSSSSPNDRRALRRDLQRNNTTIAGGYLVLRYSYEDIMFNQQAVLEQVRAVLSGRVIR